MIAARIGGVDMAGEMARPARRCKLWRERRLCYRRAMPPLRTAFAACFLLLLCACAVRGGGLAAPLARPAAQAMAEPEVPYVPTPAHVVDAMLDLAAVGAGDHLIDLGSGDGRIALAAGRRGATALGVEIDPELVARASGYARGEGLENRVRFRRQDLFATPIREASVVALYLLPTVNLRLRPRLLTELRPGTRVVSHAFDMADWRPDEMRDLDGPRIFLWIVPAPAGGRWELHLADGGTSSLELDQRFQDLSGTLDGEAIEEAALRGDVIAFTAAGRRFEGRVFDAEMRGEGWRARRMP